MRIMLIHQHIVVNGMLISALRSPPWARVLSLGGVLERQPGPADRMILIEERATQDGRDAARSTPLVAGLADVLRQWHGEVDLSFGQSPGVPADQYPSSRRAER
jgi:hypothetical protein